MLLYHGSNVVVEQPRLIESRRQLDFGPGFYLTSSLEQAEKWAVRTASIRECGKPYVSVFSLDESQLEDLSVLRFSAPDVDWLHYVVANRLGHFPVKVHDVVIGPVANDQAIRTVNNYMNGYFPEDVAIRLLLPQKLKDQFAFKTDRAIAQLQFSEARES